MRANSLNIFETHSHIIADYAEYIKSFITIDDPQIRNVVVDALSSGKLWPEPLLQFNPSFKKFGEIDDAIASGLVQPEFRDIFPGYSLYQHQAEAINLGTRHKDFIVTSGTGSGKSLTYIASIFDHILRHNDSPGVTAVIVYPMNALINSQSKEIRKYADTYTRKTGKEFPITFGQYTGQEDETKREGMRSNPPQILLTNYMMLELLLTRLRERPIRDAIFQNLRYLIFDELHTYRGRQGADIALLIRRIRSQCASDITCIGTSATMVSVGSLVNQKFEVSRVASKIFGKPIPPEVVITETLDRSIAHNADVPDSEFLRQAINTPIVESDGIDKLRMNHVAIWLENTIALLQRDGILTRGKPKRFCEIIDLLATTSGETSDNCRLYLQTLLQWISSINMRLQEQGRRYTILPYKLHQFISQTGAVYTTLDRDEHRFITLEPGVFKSDDEQKKPIFSNVFSRVTGVPMICVSRIGNRLIPREFKSSGNGDANPHDGYLIVGEDMWDPIEDSAYLPDGWFRITTRGRRPRADVEGYFPLKLYFDEFGNCSDSTPMKWWGWFMKAPLLFDPTGGVFYDARTNESTKLTKLGSEGRSTSTTITAHSILNRLHEAGLGRAQRKLLSFTDNRQDAALQAGHFNDFIQVVKVRSAIYRALTQSATQTIDYKTIGEAVFQAIALPFLDYANRDSLPPLQSIQRTYEESLKSFLFYRVIADLRRSWRIVLPNLEQCALLTIEYDGIDELAQADQLWTTVPILNELNHADRKEFIVDALEYFRLEFAIHSENYLNSSRLKENEKEFREKLKAPWTLERDESLREPFFLRYDSLTRRSGLYTKSIGSASTLGKYIKLYVRRHGLQADLSQRGYRDFIEKFMQMLKETDFLISQKARNEEDQEIPVFRLRLEKIIWRLGDGSTIRPDTVKRRAYQENTIAPNEYFQSVYRNAGVASTSMTAADHTGQLSTELRQSRETAFEQGDISTLFCSPTMELGIDIGSLGVVHMRNTPPNPSNYAQRSGRAGRSGQGAMIFTYCSTYSPHDRHYFNDQEALVAGAVQAPKLDLSNRELLESHLNALLLSEVGLPGLEEHEGKKPSLSSLIVDDGTQLPLKPEVIAGLTLSPAMAVTITRKFKAVVHDFEHDLLRSPAAWYTDQWIADRLSNVTGHLDAALMRWRRLYESALSSLKQATRTIENGLYQQTSDEYRLAKRTIDQSTRQLDLLRNTAAGQSAELSEFYPYRYLASEGFLPGYNFTRLPLRVFLPTGESAGEYVSRSRTVALREFGPLNIIYHNGRKYRVSQMILSAQESAGTTVRISKKAGYILWGEQATLDVCPFTGLNLGDNANVDYVSGLVEMGESRAEERDRISCEEEERSSRGFEIKTYFTIDGGAGDRVRKAMVKTDEHRLLNLRYIPAARLVHVNSKWRAEQLDGFPVGMSSGFWRDSLPDYQAPVTEQHQMIRLWTSTTADALYIEPIQPLGLKAEGVVTLQYALKRAIENIFQVESNEIGAVSLGDLLAPNILLYEASEGSLGVLSQFVEDKDVFHRVIQEAVSICRFDDESYKGPASYNDLLSYYNQRDHLKIDRHLIQNALDMLLKCSIEIQTNQAFTDYEAQYQYLCAHIDPQSSTEKKFIDFLHERGLRLPDEAQKTVPGLYIKPDFYYHPRCWVFCDGTPHDEPRVVENDATQRQALIARGDEVIVYYYQDSLADLAAKRSDLFRKVK
jgi:superfamily II DNA/RNA helicase